MSLYDAEKYARRVRDARDVAELARTVERALDEIIREIRDLQIRVANAER
jgi:hypothetical protein